MEEPPHIEVAEFWISNKISSNIWCTICSFLPTKEQLNIRLLNKAIASGVKISIKMTLLALCARISPLEKEIARIIESEKYIQAQKLKEEEGKIIVKLDFRNITEIRAMKCPPPAVLNCFIMVLIILGKAKEKPKTQDRWIYIKTYLKVNTFLQAIANCERDLTEKEMLELQSLVVNPDFSEDKLKRQSLACGIIIRWVFAYYEWMQLRITIVPLQKEYNKTKERVKKLKNIEL